MRSPLELEFERLANGFFAAHPEVEHEWRRVGGWSGERTDLLCGAGEPNAVFVSLSAGQIAVGIASGDHDDFESFGRRITDADVACEAFERLVALLRQNGQLSG